MLFCLLFVKLRFFLMCNVFSPLFMFCNFTVKLNWILVCALLLSKLAIKELVSLPTVTHKLAESFVSPLDVCNLINWTKTSSNENGGYYFSSSCLLRKVQSIAF